MSAPHRWAPVALWGGVILLATSIPGAALPSSPAIPGLDKMVHLTMYGVLGFLVAGARNGDAREGAGLALAAMALFAGVDEWHQQFIPGRGADALDWAADVAGATLGLSTRTLTRMARARRETRT